MAAGNAEPIDAAAAESDENAAAARDATDPAGERDETDADASAATRRATLFERAAYLVMRAWFALVCALPEGVSYRAMGWLGGLYVRLSKRRRTIALRLLRNAYPDRGDAELLRLARLGTGNLLRVALDVALLGRMVEKGRFADRIDMSELRGIDLAPPFLGVTAHLGSWECGAVGVAQLGTRAHATARRLKNPLAQAWLVESRRRAGLELHDRRGGIRGVVAALRAREIVMQVVDQNQRLRGVFVPFFGELASTERGAAALALRFRCPILVAAGIRTGVGFRFRFVVEDVLVPEVTGDASADVRALVARINHALERLIRRFPEQYLWIHDRYRTRPTEENTR